MRFSTLVIMPLTLFVIFVALLVFFGVQDHNAENRCKSLQGRTWDQGQHCVVGSYNVINTR